MTFPSGTPGGFPGQGPNQPQQQYPGAAPAPSAGGGFSMSLPQILLLVTAGLGLLNLFLGFANLGSASLGGGLSFFESGFGWVPGLLLASGLTALFGVLPGEQKPGPWPAVFALSAILPFLFTVFQSSGIKVGGVLVLIFGIIQMLVAVAVYLFTTGLLSPPSVQSSAYGPAGQQQFGQQPGGFGQQQFGQQQFGQQPASGPVADPVQSAAPGQQAGQAPTQQPTQYAAQQGQFFQQQPAEGQQQNSPGTPPGGTSQPNG